MEFLAKIKYFFNQLFSADDGLVAHAYVSNSVWMAVVMIMWVKASWSLSGALADFPPGVQVVIGIFGGVAGVTAVGGVVKSISAMSSTTTPPPPIAPSPTSGNSSTVPAAPAEDEKPPKTDD